MAERKRSHVWSYFSSTSSQGALCDVCGSTANPVKHLRLNHNTEYEAFMMRRTEEESTVVRCCCEGKTDVSGGVLRCCRQALYSNAGNGEPYSSLPVEAKFANSFGVFLVAFGLVYSASCPKTNASVWKETVKEFTGVWISSAS